MSKKEFAHINIDSLSANFEQHISEEFNDRILFSAPFGAGKSTFLKNFFDENEAYIVLKLYPVNYSVAPNQDVFEIIKYELLYELLSKFPSEIELQQDQFSMLLISQMFYLHQMKIDLPLKLLAKASSLVTGTEALNETIVDSLIQTISSFNEYKKEINKTESDLLNKHIKAVQNQKGHIYESDDITQLIIALLDRVKGKKLESNSKVKTVLLIDDLDRLDPEHVFRLFNVFSAHYDDATESNKFYFDKIIFVCDVKNVREMFNHKYGFNVEFTGYIDKFYSSEVFNFDIKKYLKESLTQIFDDKKYNPYKYFQEGEISRNLITRYNIKRGGVSDVFFYILKNMIDCNIIRIRNFKRFNQFTLPNHIIQARYMSNNAVLYPLLVLVSNLEKLFIHPVDFENALEFLYKNYQSNYEISTPTNRDQEDNIAGFIIQYSLPFLLNEKNAFNKENNSDNQEAFKYVNELNQPIYLIYKVIYDFEFSYYVVKYFKATHSSTITNGVSDTESILRPNPYWFLYNSYKNFKAKNYY